MLVVVFVVVQVVGSNGTSCVLKKKNEIIVVNITSTLGLYSMSDRTRLQAQSLRPQGATGYT